MIKRFSLALLAATAIGVVTSQGASAADMAVKAPVAPPPVPLWNWSGIYAGGFFGMGLSRNQFSEANNPLFDGVANNLCEGSCSGLGNRSLGSHNGLGPLGGFTLGWRWQGPNSPYVWGIEGQFAFADLQGSNTNAASASIFNKKNTVCFRSKDNSCLVNVNHNGQISSQVKDIATIAGTFGMTSGPQDRTLWFVKGGGAWARTNFATADNLNGSVTAFNSSGHLDPNNSFNAAASFSANSNTSRWGWLVGTGVEWGLWGNWSAKIEYDFMDFGSYDVHLNGNANVSFPGSCCSFSTQVNRTVHVNQQIHMVQVGLNYKFDWGHW
jgi:outer membrane immunogenic protein